MTAAGRYGRFGGQYIPETLMPAVQELERAFDEARRDEAFTQELNRILREWVGRPTPLTDAPRLAEAVGLRRVTLKREDLAHTGAHKINNAVGQALLARRMGKRRVIAETGAGQHGVASAAACALLGLECVVYMGTEDMRRQEPNVFRMRLLGAEVRGLRQAYAQAGGQGYWGFLLESSTSCLTCGGAAEDPGDFRLAHIFTFLGRHKRALAALEEEAEQGKPASKHDPVAHGERRGRCQWPRRDLGRCALTLWDISRQNYDRAIHIGEVRTMDDIRILASGLGFPEGPVAMAARAGAHGR